MSKYVNIDCINLIFPEYSDLRTRGSAIVGIFIPLEFWIDQLRGFLIDHH